MAARALGNKAARTYGSRDSLLVWSRAKKEGKKTSPKVTGIECSQHNDVEALCVGDWQVESTELSTWSLDHRNRHTTMRSDREAAKPSL